jgi:hypothetical protein
MKILTAKNLIKAAMIAPLLSGTAAFALTINDPGVVGTVKDASPPSFDNVYVQTLLNMGPSEHQFVPNNPPLGDHTYDTSSTDYNGLLSGAGHDGTGTTLDAGYDFAIAKYGNGNNNNGGGVVYYLPTFGLTIPGGFPFGDNANGLSGWTEFNASDITIIPPEGTPTPDGGATMLLLGGGVSALAFLRRKLS